MRRRCARCAIFAIVQTARAFRRIGPARRRRSRTTVAFACPCISSDEPQPGIGIGGTESRRSAASSEQQLGEPATSQRDAAAATAAGRPGGTGAGRAGRPGRPGLSATAPNDVASAAQPPAYLAYKSLHGM